MGVEGENLLLPHAVEALHHGEDDDENGDAEHDAEHGKDGDDREEGPLGLEIL